MLHFVVLQQNAHTSRLVDTEVGAAMVMTIKSTQISACSCGSLVCKGKFQGKQFFILSALNYENILEISTCNC